MAWQNKASKMAMGQFVRVKSERMAIVRFDGEPTEAKSKDFNGKPVDELQFPVTFWDERSVSDRYAEGEAAKMVRDGKGEAKLFPTSGGPLLRELMAEDREESIMGRTFIISHTGTARDTSYKFREVKVPKQAVIAREEEEEENISDEKEPEAVENVEEQEAKEKEKFKKEVAKRTKARKTATKKDVENVPPARPEEAQDDEA